MYSVKEMLHIVLCKALLTALCLCTQLSVDSMVSNKIDDGQIIMIGSMSGHRVPPNPSTRQMRNDLTHFNLVIDKIDRFYAASKFAVTGLLEGWRQELRDIGGNIRVCGISPGAPHYTLDQ